MAMYITMLDNLNPRKKEGGMEELIKIIKEAYQDGGLGAVVGIICMGGPMAFIMWLAARDRIKKKDNKPPKD